MKRNLLPSHPKIKFFSFISVEFVLYLDAIAVPYVYLKSSVVILWRFMDAVIGLYKFCMKDG